MLLAVAGVLVFALGDGGDDDGLTERATATCAGFAERVQDEFTLSFPDGVPNDAAYAEYLARAFADTMEELVAELRAAEPGGDVAAIVDALADRVADVRATPADFVAANPFTEVGARFDRAGLPACGSEFFAGSQ